MAVPDDSRRAAGRARAKTEATAKALVGFPSGLTLDFSKITISNLPAAKLALEIPEPYEEPLALGVSIVAVENIPACAPMTSQGKRADSGNPSASFGRVIGLASETIKAGCAGRIIRVGEITNPAWAWATGEQIFLSGTGLSNAAPCSGFVQRIGTASGPAKVIVDLGEPILL